MAGKELCGGHDPETRAKAQLAGGNARMAARPGFLSREATEAAISFDTRADIKRTLERLAKLVCSGELEARAVNATVIAASHALAVIAAEDAADKRRAEAMSDEELEAAFEAALEEREARRAEAS